jgi:hypothetical protein
LWLVGGVITKDFRTYTMIFLRQEKSLRDHGGGLGTWCNTNLRHHERRMMGFRTGGDS